MSTLDGSKEDEFARNYGDYFKGFEEQSVDKRRIDTLLEKHNIVEIDLLSLDIEGYEIEALRGLNLSKYKPKVMVIESDSKQHEKGLDEIVGPHYLKVLKHGGNVFYVRKDFPYDSILDISEDIELFHKGNPFDQEEDINQKAFLTTNLRKSVLRYLISKVRGIRCYRSQILN